MPERSRIRRFVEQNALSLVFGLLFLLSLVGQAWSGWTQFNDTQAAEGFGQVSIWQYVTSADFAVDVSENWQSEYLQFLVFIVLTIWLVQVGSTESKKPGEEGLESEEEQSIGAHANPDSPKWAKVGGWRTLTFSWSLTLVMGAIFLGAWITQWIAGWAAYNETQLQQLLDPVSLWAYLGNADFWSRTLQNWQSEFLAVGSMAIFSVYLRQRGSSQSKPVGSAHDTTGVDG